MFYFLHSNGFSGEAEEKVENALQQASRPSHNHNDRLIAGVVCILLAGIVWITFGQTLRTTIS